MELKGLVLVGGHSSRMGADKSSINYKGRPHRAYLAEILLGAGCNSVHFSCSAHQAQTIDFEFPVIVDIYSDSGPISGLLSAFFRYPKAAWLIVGCDYALLDFPTVRQLIEQRDDTADATVFRNLSTDFLEPLVAIYEPGAYPKIKTAFDKGQRSLRKILQTLETQIIPLTQANKLLNVNTLKEKQAVLKYLGK